MTDVRKRVSGRKGSLVSIFIVSLLAVCAAGAQDEERRLWDAEFLKKRQPAKAAPKSSAKRPPAYRRATPKPTVPAAAAAEKVEGEMVGVTLWRLRAAKAEDGSGARLLLQQNGRSKEWVPERVESDTAFSAGEEVRLGIESPRDGYLYVIDREQYADGSFSEPYLIYPTLQNRGGNNAVAAGKLIELPDRSAFTLKPLREDYRGEVLTLLITKEPLAELKVGADIVKLETPLLAQWEKQWGAPVERFELVGGAGKTYTLTEKEAGDGARLLTQEDEPPQTLYRVVAKPGDPILITVQLRIVR